MYVLYAKMNLIAPDNYLVGYVYVCVCLGFMHNLMSSIIFLAVMQIESRDPTTGCVYYYNQKSGQSQWEKPVGPTSLNSQPSSSPLLGDWQEVLDETSGM